MHSEPHFFDWNRWQRRAGRTLKRFGNGLIAVALWFWKIPAVQSLAGFFQPLFRRFDRGMYELWSIGRSARVHSGRATHHLRLAYQRNRAMFAAAVTGTVGLLLLCFLFFSYGHAAELKKKQATARRAPGANAKRPEPGTIDSRLDPDAKPWKAEFGTYGPLEFSVPRDVTLIAQTEPVPVPVQPEMPRRAEPAFEKFEPVPQPAPRPVPEPERVEKFEPLPEEKPTPIAPALEPAPKMENRLPVVAKPAQPVPTLDEPLLAQPVPMPRPVERFPLDEPSNVKPVTALPAAPPLEPALEEPKPIRPEPAEPKRARPAPAVQLPVAEADLDIRLRRQPKPLPPQNEEAFLVLSERTATGEQGDDREVPLNKPAAAPAPRPTSNVPPTSQFDNSDPTQGFSRQPSRNARDFQPNANAIPPMRSAPASVTSEPSSKSTNNFAETNTPRADAPRDVAPLGPRPNSVRQTGGEAEPVEKPAAIPSLFDNNETSDLESPAPGRKQSNRGPAPLESPASNPADNGKGPRDVEPLTPASPNTFPALNNPPRGEAPAADFPADPKTAPLPASPGELKDEPRSQDESPFGKREVVKAAISQPASPSPRNVPSLGLDIDEPNGLSTGPVNDPLNPSPPMSAEAPAPNFAPSGPAAANEPQAPRYASDFVDPPLPKNIATSQNDPLSGESDFGPASPPQPPVGPFPEAGPARTEAPQDKSLPSPRPAFDAAPEPPPAEKPATSPPLADPASRREPADEPAEGFDPLNSPPSRSPAKNLDPLNDPLPQAEANPLDKPEPRNDADPLKPADTKGVALPVAEPKAARDFEPAGPAPSRGGEPFPEKRAEPTTPQVPAVPSNKTVPSVPVAPAVPAGTAKPDQGASWVPGLDTPSTAPTASNFMSGRWAPFDPARLRAATTPQPRSPLLSTNLVLANLDAPGDGQTLLVRQVLADEGDRTTAGAGASGAPPHESGLRLFAAISASTNVRSSRLRVDILDIEPGIRDEYCPIEFRVTNVGAVKAENAIVEVDLPAILSHRNGQLQKCRIGDLEPGMARVVRLLPQGAEVGEGMVRARAVNERGVDDVAERRIRVQAEAPATSTAAPVIEKASHSEPQRPPQAGEPAPARQAKPNFPPRRPALLPRSEGVEPDCRYLQKPVRPESRPAALPLAELITIQPRTTAALPAKTQPDPRPMPIPKVDNNRKMLLP